MFKNETSVGVFDAGEIKRPSVSVCLDGVEKLSFWDCACEEVDMSVNVLCVSDLYDESVH